MAAESYGVSVLRADQQEASNAFARLAGALAPEAAFETWTTGAPVLKTRLAGFDCRIAQRHEAGDHVVLVGEVMQFDACPGAPLLYFASRYAAGPEVEAEKGDA